MELRFALRHVREDTVIPPPPVEEVTEFPGVYFLYGVEGICHRQLALEYSRFSPSPRWPCCDGGGYPWFYPGQPEYVGQRCLMNLMLTPNRIMDVIKSPPGQGWSSMGVL